MSDATFPSVNEQTLRVAHIRAALGLAKAECRVRTPTHDAAVSREE